jgi:hypothetical protein
MILAIPAALLLLALIVAPQLWITSVMLAAPGYTLDRRGVRPPAA